MVDDPIITYYENGNIQYEYWYKDNKLHRLNKPAIIWYYKNGNVECEEWWEGGKKHQLNQPAEIYYDENGNIKKVSWYKDDEYYIFDDWIKLSTLSQEQQIELKLKYG